MHELKELKEFSRELAICGAKIIKNYFRTPITVNLKKDKSPVTIANKKAEEIMREFIMREFPHHGIYGEEFGMHNKDAEYMWILDPIDGTKSFICGVLSFGTLIALEHKRIPILGVINHPILNEFLIGDNLTAELNGQSVSVRNCKSLNDAVLLATDHFNIGNYQNQNKFDALVKKVKLYRNWGDCYGYYLVATGFADVMIDPAMNYWDKSALVPIIKGAGGIITDYRGGDPLSGNSIIAASPGIHNEIINALN